MIVLSCHSPCRYLLEPNDASKENVWIFWFIFQLNDLFSLWKRYAKIDILVTLTRLSSSFSLLSSSPLPPPPPPPPLQVILCHLPQGGSSCTFLHNRGQFFSLFGRVKWGIRVSTCLDKPKNRLFCSLSSCAVKQLLLNIFKEFSSIA